MKLSTLLLILVLGAAIIFAYQNEPLLRQMHTVMLPGGPQTVPVVVVLLAMLAAVVALMWLADVADAAAASARRWRAERLLAERERELADLRARGYEEISRKIDDLSRKVDERFWARNPEAAEGPEQEQTTVWRRTGS